jgi:hypothetical protein
MLWQTDKRFKLMGTVTHFWTQVDSRCKSPSRGPSGRSEGHPSN